MKRSAEVSAIDTVVTGRFRVVDVLAFGAVEFHVRGVGDVVLAHGEEGLGFADYAGAFAEGSLFVFFHLFGNRVNIDAGAFCTSDRRRGRIICRKPKTDWKGRNTLTILASPRVVTTYLACTNPYKCRALFSICSRISSSTSMSKTSVTRSSAYW